MTATCVDCARGFQARGSWQTRCWPCWRAHRDEETRADAYDTGYDAGYRAGTRDAPPASLGAALLADLVALAHPDRHPPERAALAHRATVALLALRAETKVAA